MRTSINLNVTEDQNHIRNLHDIMDGHRYYETPDVFSIVRKQITYIKDGCQFPKNQPDWSFQTTKFTFLQNLLQGLETGFYLSGR